MTYSLLWKALISLLQAKGDKWDTNEHGLDLTHSDHVHDLSSKLNGTSVVTVGTQLQVTQVTAHHSIRFISKK